MTTQKRFFYIKEINMKYFFLVFVVFITFLSNAQINPEARTKQVKKGVGLSEKNGLNEYALELLNVSWYYNWGLTSKLKTKIDFIPMVFSTTSIYKVTNNYNILLGFNEPDNEKQSGISVNEAFESWNLLVNKTNVIGSPATAGNPLKEDSWLEQFMNKNPKVNFITVHWYKGCNADKFIQDMTEIINKYKLPIWITEFAPQTVSESKENPNKFSQDEVNEFMGSVIQWMENEPMVERYAWHDSKTGTSAIFNENGSLTKTGLVYSKINLP